MSVDKRQQLPPPGAFPSPPGPRQRPDPPGAEAEREARERARGGRHGGGCGPAGTPLQEVPARRGGGGEHATSLVPCGGERGAPGATPPAPPRPPDLPSSTQSTSSATKGSRVLSNMLAAPGGSRGDSLGPRGGSAAEAAGRGCRRGAPRERPPRAPGTAEQQPPPALRYCRRRGPRAPLRPGTGGGAGREGRAAAAAAAPRTALTDAPPAAPARAANRDRAALRPAPSGAAHGPGTEHGPAQLPGTEGSPAKRPGTERSPAKRPGTDLPSPARPARPRGRTGRGWNLGGRVSVLRGEHEEILLLSLFCSSSSSSTQEKSCFHLWNHRILRVGRNHSGSCGPTSRLKLRGRLGSILLEPTPFRYFYTLTSSPLGCLSSQGWTGSPLSPSSWERCSSSLITFVALCWTCSRSSMSLLGWTA